MTWRTAAELPCVSCASPPYLSPPAALCFHAELLDASKKRADYFYVFNLGPVGISEANPSSSGEKCPPLDII